MLTCTRARVCTSAFPNITHRITTPFEEISWTPDPEQSESSAFFNIVSVLKNISIFHGVVNDR